VWATRRYAPAADQPDHAGYPLPMEPRGAFLRVAPWGLVGCFAVLAVLAVVVLVDGYALAALHLGLMFGLAALGCVFIGGPWLILWPRQTRPPLSEYLRALARGRPITPPGRSRRD
jgi:hypothetical protein